MKALTAGGGIWSGRVPKMALIFVVVGIVLGLLFGWAKVSIFSQSNPQQEYIVMVAALYDREQILSNAQERLAVLHVADIASMVSKEASSYADQHKDKITTINSLRNLEQALKGSAASGATASATPAQNGAPDTSVSGGFPPFAFLIIVIVVVGLGYFAFDRFSGTKRTAENGNGKLPMYQNAEARKQLWPSHWRPVTEDDTEDEFSRVLSNPTPLTDKPTNVREIVAPTDNSSYSRTYTTGNVSEPRPYMVESTTGSPAESPDEEIQADELLATIVQTPAQSSTMAGTPNPHSIAKPIVQHPPSAPRPLSKGGWKAEPKSGSMVFDCHYRYDDDPYDEVYSIIDPLTRVTVGACGVSSAGKLPGRQGGIYSFTIWLHDYGSGDEVHCVGIVSKWAETNRALELREWARKDHLRKVICISDFSKLVLETSGLRANTTVVGFDYIESASAPNSGCFRSLNLRFHVMTLA